MSSTTSSRKDVVTVTDDELYDWVKSIYKEEELDPACLRFLTSRASYVFTQPVFKAAFLSIRRLGRIENRASSEAARFNTIELTPREEEDPKIATLYRMLSCDDDFVIVDAMIRLGADTDIELQDSGGMEATLLSWHCSRIECDVSSEGQINPLRSRIIHRLLQVGVDPNIGYPLHHACGAGDIKTAALLLEYGADPSVVTPDDNKRSHQLLPGALRKRFQKLRRRKKAIPPGLCWCLESGLPFDECHGGAEPKECDPFFGCPCQSGKLYSKCCQKQGIIHTETRDRVSYQRGSMVLWNDHVNKLYDDLVSGVEPTDTIFRDLATDDPHQDFRQRLAAHMMNSVSRDLFDPAYGHALKKTCFPPTYAVGLLPKNECKDRRDEWNAAVDDYIATKDGDTGDHRDAVQIERLSKVAWDGTRLYKECSGCGAIEDKVEDFKACSYCKMRHYCSKECQAQHWRSGGHKQKCGIETESENETLYFPSHKSISEFAVGYMSDFMD